MAQCTYNCREIPDPYFHDNAASLLGTVGATPLKILSHPVNARPFKMGLCRPVARGPRSISKTTCSVVFRLLLLLWIIRRTPRGSLSQVRGNDRLGDCTAAGAFHVGGLLLANAGVKVPYGERDVVAFYSATTGYIPGIEATDRGGDEQTVLNYWQEKGLLPGQHKIAGWLGLNGRDAVSVKTALWLMENFYFGVELPDKWINPMPAASGFVWDVAGTADPSNGHCFVGVGYNEKGVQIDTWGMIGTITWAAVAEYASTVGSGELYTVLGPDGDRESVGKGAEWLRLVAALGRFR